MHVLEVNNPIAIQPCIHNYGRRTTRRSMTSPETLTITPGHLQAQLSPMDR